MQVRRQEMADHYKTLGVTMAASAEDVKRAFRALAKKHHPDRNAGRAQWANALMKRLLEANRILSNVILRKLYDRKYVILTRRQRPHPRWSRDVRGSDLRGQAQGILYDLLSGKEDRGLNNYEKLLRTNHGFELRRHMEFRDWVDCKFLLAEQYQKASRYKTALALYEELYQSEQARGRYAHFKQEVRDRILRICCHDLAPSAPPENAARYYLRALALELTRGRRAFLHKKLAECHLAVGDEESARRQLGIAFRLKPDLKGATKVSQKLGVGPTGG